ncbi:dihydrofolate reductase family protein [Streptomyces sp. NPDC006733]|uniref:dihydrofolate reductase family protein n=1 Tax=Streptomyces sp. NPDC006733 TaxID=3155460 RepID=UPI00340CC8BE
MPKLRAHNITITLDGYATGTDQRLEAPFGDGVDGLHDWMNAAMRDLDEGRAGVGADYIERGDENVGATIMGRNMFGPVRGPWQDESWTGWWGENPPYHTDVFVHTHYPRPSVPMKGGTTFHFTDEPVETVLRRAFEAAGGKDVRLGGGPSTVQTYLRAGLLDELHLVIAPIVAGRGVRLLDNWQDAADGYRVAEQISSGTATHVRLVRR